MATSNVTVRPNISADIIPPALEVRVSQPGPDGWAKEEVWLDLEPTSMVWSDNGKPSTLSLRYHLGAAPETGRAQLAAEKVTMPQPGAKVRLVDHGDWKGRGEWFCGYVGQETLLVQTGVESCTVTAYGPEIRLGGKVCRGQFFPTWDTESKLTTDADPGQVLTRDYIQQTDLPCVFNQGGRANMQGQQWTVATADKSDAGGAVFCVPDRRAVFEGIVYDLAASWTAYRAVRSIIEWFDDYKIISPLTDWKAIESVLAGAEIGEVNVDGMPLTEALREILGPLGFGYRLDPWTDGSDRHVLSVYSLTGRGKRGLTPYLPPDWTEATSANGARAEVARLEVLRDTHNARNAVTVLGNRRRVQMELTFRRGYASDLWPAWDTKSGVHDLGDFMTDGLFKITSLGVDELTTLEDWYSPGGSNFNANRDVYRTFVFNETGDSLDQGRKDGLAACLPHPENYGLGNALYPRPIGPQLTQTVQGAEWLPAKVVLSSGGYSVDITDKVDILKDRAGFRFKDDVHFFSTGKGTGDVSVWRPLEGVTGTAMGEVSYFSMLYGSLQDPGEEVEHQLTITVTGTLESVDCVQGAAGRSANSPVPWTAERLIRDDSLVKREVRGGSTGLEDTRDDTSSAVRAATKIRNAGDCAMGHASILLHILSRAYPPGTVIPSTAGRAINLRLDSQKAKASPVVRQAVYTFGESNMTELLLDSPMLGMT